MVVLMKRPTCKQSFATGLFETQHGHKMRWRAAFKKGLELVTAVLLSFQILSCESALIGLVGWLVLFYYALYFHL